MRTRTWSGPGGRSAVGLVLACLLAAACTGTQRPDELGVGGGPASETVRGDEPGVTTDADGAAPTVNGPGTTTAPGVTTPRSGLRSTETTTRTSGGNDGGGSGPTPATVFAAQDDRIGIDDDSVNLCIHAALQLGAVFNNTPEDLKIYWDVVNAEGGVHGRRVQVTFTDDQGSPQGGVQAAQQCKANQAFIMGGSVGFDTVPAVRQFAEQHGMLYLSSFATESDIGRYRRSFTFLPSIERLGSTAGQYVATSYSGRKVGVVWRNSPNWQGGRDHFRAAVEAKGGRVVADVPVEKNQGDFTNAIFSLKGAGAEVVLAWIGVVEIAQLVKQARVQAYRPSWVVAGFNLVTDSLGHDIDGTDGPQAVGFNVNPPYPPDPGADYRGEVDRMHAAFARFRPSKNGKINDNDWSMWLYGMQMHRILLDCGRDCTRNRLAGMFLAGYRFHAPPACVVDFGRGGGRLGGFGVELYKAVPNGGGSRWSTAARCAERF